MSEEELVKGLMICRKTWRWLCHSVGMHFTQLHSETGQNQKYDKCWSWYILIHEWGAFGGNV